MWSSFNFLHMKIWRFIKFLHRRGTMDISDIGTEAMIHWNGPPIALANSLGKAALDRHFGPGRYIFHHNLEITV